ncbi:tyrosine-type recombinase/integrase [Aestuariivirga sp.]|uniref:tyrosine-type recombinase/integrase n=1 Tax=Aestuariivirga sp. TaxID=2650926 RepID=UPI0039E55AE6
MALSDSKLRNLRPNGKRFELPDRDGLSIRVSQRGVMSWTVTYRIRGAGEDVGSRRTKLAGKKTRLTLGEYPTMSLADARQEAARIKLQARAGKPIRQDADTSPEELTVKELFLRFQNEHIVRRHRANSSVAGVLQRHMLPLLANRLISSLRRDDLVVVLESARLPRLMKVEGKNKKAVTVTRGGVGAAAHVRKWTVAMFQFAVESGLLASNPFSGVRNRDRQISRDRVLSMMELRSVWRAATAMKYPWGPFFQLLMLTGDRRGEWANAQMHWLDERFSQLEIPSSSYKTGKTHIVPLSHQASHIIRSLPKQEHGPFIFSTTAGIRPVSGFSKAKIELDGLVGRISGAAIKPWVVHDLRRSMATHMERLGIEPHVVEVCLGHALKGIASVYRHYSYLPEKRAALQLWADELMTESTALSS